MHEYSIVSAMMARVEHEAALHQATRVRAVKVRIGERAGVEIGLLRTAYDIVRPGSLCADAPLEIEVVPVRWACQRCAAAPAPGARLQCPCCGAPVRLISGDEILLERLELEVP